MDETFGEARQIEQLPDHARFRDGDDLRARIAHDRLFYDGSGTLLGHAIGALLIFVGTMIFGSIFWISLEWHKESSLVLRVCSECVFVFFACLARAMLAVIVQYPADFQLFMTNPLGYAVELIGNTTDTKLGWVRFFEWFYITSIVLWSMIMSDYSIKIARAWRKGLVKR